MEAYLCIRLRYRNQTFPVFRGDRHYLNQFFFGKFVYFEANMENLRVNIVKDVEVLTLKVKI